MAACALARREVSKISGGSQLKEFVAQEDAPGPNRARIRRGLTFGSDSVTTATGVGRRASL